MTSPLSQRRERRRFDAPDLLRSIWASAYGAAYVSHFDRIDRAADFGFDDAMQMASAERAETIADQAVAEWLLWNREGKAP